MKRLKVKRLIIKLLRFVFRLSMMIIKLSLRLIGSFLESLYEVILDVILLNFFGF